MRTASKTSALILLLFIALSSLTVLTATASGAQTISPDSIQTVNLDHAPSWASPICESPALPAWSWLIGLSLLVAAILVAVVLRYREIKHY